MVLMAKSCGRAKMTKGQKNQLAAPNEDGSPVALVDTRAHEVGGGSEELEQDRRDSRTEGRGPERLRLGGVTREIAGIVGSVLCPAEPSGRDDENQCGRPDPPRDVLSLESVLRWAFGMTRAAMTANTTMNTKERYRRILVIVAWPRNGITN